MERTTAMDTSADPEKMEMADARPDEADQGQGGADQGQGGLTKSEVAFQYEFSEESYEIKRETWTHAMDFLMACIGFSVGLGNVWRFPYLCYKNGGGAFLIPYFTAVLFGGIPLFYLEVAIGQYTSQGGMQAWNMVPLMQGIGLAACIIVFYLNCYYNVIMTWGFYYFFSSFTSTLPWEGCNHEWNSKENCSTNFAKTMNETGREESTLLDPVTEFWENKVLGINNSPGIHDLGKLKWDLVLCLAFAWVVVYLCICKGIKSSGRVVYFTATTPYILMAILLIRNATLEGAGVGLKYYLTFDIAALNNRQVWVAAGTQVFFSNSLALGTLTALGSYNRFHRDSFKDSVIFTCVNSFTSIFAGFIVFSILGFMAVRQGKSVADVAESGPGLAFIAYPLAVTQLPGAPFWSMTFFLMIILLGLDSQFVGVEGVVTTVVDQYPRLLRRGYRREIFIAVACVAMFLVGLSMCTEGGMYVFQLFDEYSGSRIVVLVGLIEMLTISYVYGIWRFRDNVLMMLGDSKLVKLLPYMVICWSVLSPVYCAIIFTLSVYDYQELTYTRSNDRVYRYPDWGYALGWGIAGSSTLAIPICIIYKLIKYGCSKTMLKMMIVPFYLKPHQMRPQDHGEKNLREYLRSTGQLRRSRSTSEKTSQQTSDRNVSIRKEEEEPNVNENFAYECDDPKWNGPTKL